MLLFTCSNSEAKIQHFLHNKTLFQSFFGSASIWVIMVMVKGATLIFSAGKFGTHTGTDPLDSHGDRPPVRFKSPENEIDTKLIREEI